MCYFMEQNQQRAENETVPGIYISHFFQDYAIKSETIGSYYHLSSEDQNKKNVQLD